MTAGGLVTCPVCSGPMDAWRLFNAKLRHGCSKRCRRWAGTAGRLSALPAGERASALTGDDRRRLREDLDEARADARVRWLDATRAGGLDLAQVDADDLVAADRGVELDRVVDHLGAQAEGRRWKPRTVPGVGRMWRSGPVMAGLAADSVIRHVRAGGGGRRGVVVTRWRDGVQVPVTSRP